MKYIINVKNYPKYMKTIFERHIKPRLFVLKDLPKDYKPNFITPENNTCVNESEIKWFNIFSYKINIFEKIEWYKDISSDRIWPKINYKKIKIKYSDNSDIKYIWEIGRLQFLINLGVIYKKTNNEKYAIKFKEIITDFYLENPINLGPNWKCTMDVAIRAINLIYAYNYFKNSKSITKEFWGDYFNNLYKTAQFINNNLEWAPDRGNHYLSNIVGLLYLGTIFKDTKNGQKWATFAITELESEIKLQITNDGVNIEGSTSYHRLVTELFLYSYIFSKTNKIKMSDIYIAQLKKALSFVYYCTMNCGLTPQVGDSDNGQIIKLNNKRDINDQRYLLQLSDIYFNTKYNQTDIENETMFFVGSKKIKKYKLIPICKFFSCGYAIFRNKDFFILIKCGIKNQIKGGGHTHNDQLSFLLEYKKDYIFVDPGTYTYTGNPDIRNYFRSVVCHNVAEIDYKEPNNLTKELFRLEYICCPQLNKFKLTNQFLIFEGLHKGYSKLKDPVIYNRKIVLDLFKKEMILTDFFNSSKLHSFKHTLNLHPNCKINKNNETLFNNSKIKVWSNEINYKNCYSVYSNGYGEIQKSKSLYGITELKRAITKIRFM